MRLLLICAGGMSTGFLVRKLKTYAQEQGWENFECEAHGAGSVEELYKKWDLILYGPQIRIYATKFRKIVGDDYPMEMIDPKDYGIQNAEHILDQAQRLLNEKNKA